MFLLSETAMSKGFALEKISEEKTSSFFHFTSSVGLPLLLKLGLEMDRLPESAQKAGNEPAQPENKKDLKVPLRIWSLFLAKPSLVKLELSFLVQAHIYIIGFQRVLYVVNQRRDLSSSDEHNDHIRWNDLYSTVLLGNQVQRCTSSADRRNKYSCNSLRQNI